MKVIRKDQEDTTMDFETLGIGDCFIDEAGDLMMKLDEEQDAVDLNNGHVYGNMCGDRVTRVNAEVHIID